MSYYGAATDFLHHDVVELLDTAPPTVDPSQVAIVARSLSLRAPLVIEGPAAVGKTSVVVAAAALRRRSALIVDLERCTVEQLSLALRQALLLDAVFVLRARGWSLASELRDRVLELVQEGVAILSVRDGTEPASALREARRIRISLPPVALRQRIWMSLLPAAAAPLVTFDLCVRHPLPPGEIAHAVEEARRLAANENREITAADLERAAPSPGRRHLRDPGRQSARNRQEERKVGAGTEGALSSPR